MPRFLEFFTFFAGFSPAIFSLPLLFSVSVTGIAVVGVKIEGSSQRKVGGQSSGSYMVCGLLNLNIFATISAAVPLGNGVAQNITASGTITQAGYNMTGDEIIQYVTIEVEWLTEFILTSNNFKLLASNLPRQVKSM
jgi:hypothetical protein